MPILLLLFLFLGLIIIFRLYFGWRQAIVFSWLSILSLTYFSTEFLSFFIGLNYTNLVLYYAFLGLLISLFIYKNHRKIYPKLNFNSYQFSKINNIILCIFLGYVLILTFLCIYCPPNNWDSMTYHLGRVAHWQQNQHIEHYATHISRQLYNPPLVEYLLIHILILSGNDYFLNIVQLVSLIACLITLSLIIKELGYSLKTQILILIVGITIPMAILQATNTKNELTMAFLLVFFIYYLIKTYHKLEIKNGIMLGLCLGICIVTKSTCYIYLPPCIIVFFTAMLFKNYKKTILIGLLTFLLSLCIASPYYIRNYKSYNHVLGATETERGWLTNSEFSLNTLFSNLSRNAFIHLANVRLLENREVFIKNGSFYHNLIYDLHEKLNIKINDPKTTWGNNVAYNIEIDEDYVGNYFHFLLIIFSIILLLIFAKYFKTTLTESLIMFSVICIALFFSIYLKWQPWHSRLHLPIFMLSTVLIAIFLSKINRYIRASILTLLVFGSITYLLENQSKILFLKSRKIFNLTRNQMMFNKKGDDYMNNLDSASAFLASNNAKNIGLEIDGDTWDYAIFKTLKSKNNNIKIEHINVSEQTTPKFILNKTPILNCDYILSTILLRSDSITYNNKTFCLSYKNNDFVVFKNNYTFFNFQK